MKRIKPMILWSGLFLFAAFLLRFPKAAADGALQGLILSFKTVIPALFPYFASKYSMTGDILRSRSSSSISSVLSSEKDSLERSTA